VSIVVPARNEALTIVQSVRALFALDYEAREIVVVNDGSSDDTLALLQRAFVLGAGAPRLRSAHPDRAGARRLPFD
jgi:glycosyltransferase involved in cell wall biosynthesis